MKSILGIIFAVVAGLFVVVIALALEPGRVPVTHEGLVPPVRVSEAASQRFGEAIADDGTEIVGLIEPLLARHPQPERKGSAARSTHPARANTFAQR
jgi:hypothetical protein